jgi:hypothetical protein
MSKQVDRLEGTLWLHGGGHDSGPPAEKGARTIFLRLS